MDVFILIDLIIPVQFLLNLTTYTSFHYYQHLTGFRPLDMLFLVVLTLYYIKKYEYYNKCNCIILIYWSDKILHSVNCLSCIYKDLNSISKT